MCRPSQWSSHAQPQYSTQLSTQDPAQDNPAFGSGGTMGFAPAGESVEGFGAGAVKQDGVVKSTGDVGGERNVGLAGEGGFEVFGHHFRPELYFYNGAKSFAEDGHIDQGAVSSQYTFAFEASHSFSHGGGAEVDLFAQFSPANPAVELKCGDDSPVDLV